MLAGHFLGRGVAPVLVALILTATATADTQVVLLGTGTPPADPDRCGPATAIVVNGTPYRVDFGVGIVRRAKSAVVDRGIVADPKVLTHEWLAKRRDFHEYAAQHHTTTTQLTELAKQAKPGLLVLYHASLHSVGAGSTPPPSLARQ